MKSIRAMSALGVLLLGASSGLSLAAAVGDTGFAPGPQLLLAEGGSERLLVQSQQRRQTLSSDEGERFVQLLQAQPTAAGVAPASMDEPQGRDQATAFRSPILRDRDLYGSPH